MKKTTIVAAVLIAGTAVTAFAHSGATGIVKERMDAMLAMGKAVKTVAPMMRGETAYDAETVRDAARLFQQHAGESMTKLFPEGSDGKPSEAKPEIWTDWNSFAGLAAQLETFSAGLAAAADNGLMMAGTQHGSMMEGSNTMMGSSGMGSGSMMGAGGMMGGARSVGDLSQMPADGVFMMLSQVCSACHTRFRAE